MSWDTGADELKVFFGTLGGSMVQQGTTQTGLGAFVGTLTLATIGASDILGNNSLNGWIAYYAFKAGSIWTPLEFAEMHNAARNSSAN
jgi:hypothetical protein